MSEVFTSKKKMGFGLMRLPVLNPNDEGSVDVEQLKKMVDLFLEKGFTYFDTAWMYCGFNSENAIKTALVDRYPRDKFTLATKLHSGFIDTLEDRDKVFDQQRAKTGVDFFDYYLIHNVNVYSKKKYDDLDVWTWIQEKKAAGLAKHIGFSFHDSPELLDEVLTEHPFFEFVQLQINYVDWDSAGIQSRKCYEVAAKHNIPVVVMEPVKGGTLANVSPAVEKLFKDYAPDAPVASWAMRFVASLDNVKIVLSGMSTLQQTVDNTSYMEDFKPLTDEEQEVIKKALRIINSEKRISCTGCSYCTDGCPMHIAIPKYFSTYNAEMLQNPDNTLDWTPQKGYYESMIANFGKASDCIGCGQCESMCPQHLNIIDLLKDVAERFEK